MSLGHSNSALALETLLAPELAGAPDSIHSSALFSAPARALLEQVDVPKGRRAAMIDAAGILIDEGVKTPEELASRLNKLAPNGALRQYSRSFWRLMTGFDSTLVENPDWQAIYAKLDMPKKKPARKKNAPARVPARLSAEDEMTLANQEATAKRDAQVREAIATMPPMYQQALELSQSGLSIPEIAERMNRSETAANSLVWVSAQKLRLLLETNERNLKPTVQVEAENLPVATPIQTNFTSLTLAKPADVAREKIEAVRTEVQSIPLSESAYVAKDDFDPSPSELREIRRVLGLADTATQIVVPAIVSGDSCEEAAERAGINPEKAAFCYIEFSRLLNIRIRSLNYHKWRRRTGFTAHLPPLMERVILDRYFTAKDCCSFLDAILVPSLTASLAVQGEASKPDQRELNAVLSAAEQYSSLPSEHSPPSGWSGCVWTAGTAILGLVLIPIGIGVLILIGAVIAQVIWSDKQAHKWKAECEQAKQRFKNGPAYAKSIQIAGAVIAHEKQQEDRKKRYNHHWAEMDWRTLEVELAKLFSKMGFRAEATPPSNDGGVDVVALKDSVKTVIQCKQHEAVIGSPDVVQLIGTAKIQKAEVAIMYSKSGFTSGARETAKNAGVILWTLHDLVAHARKVYGI